jgi:uncharacterized protein YecA (UPF0149 family)
MGAIADAFVAYAQPLLDQTDGSLEQMNKAFAISQLCYNIAISPEERREKMINELRPTLQMNDEEFDEFQLTIVIPMIRRHEEMFPQMHRLISPSLRQSTGPSLQIPPRSTAPTEAYPGTNRYAPCPCQSGEKYKFCCGAKRS